ncbi:hypothetical protein FHS16_004880 [Paenibacillus endophyticus]|uniref:Uncharacterized protein n=1 Tax=Paenibacillus endophyticus TaxID=1294268 RepID=A0A7W5CBS9_9BACL|nr:hypothetical protein [Paenibacillus endophyticus]MBB3154798.1 hypothetical protein [Paenibacillus endophyticus]
MIKLLKYDWKRSNDGILSTLAILIIVQAALSIVGLVKDWDENLIVGLSIFGYVLAFILLFIHSLRTFDTNIKSYSRRLLPQHPIKGIGASILLCWIVLGLITLIAAIHIPIFAAFSNNDWSFIKDNIKFVGAAKAIVIVEILWAYTLFIISILASITVAGCFRFKGAAWIGIIFFFAIHSLLIWIDYLLFGDNESSAGFVSITSDVGDTTSVTLSSNLKVDYFFGTFLLETLFTGALIYLTVYLLKKKVEIQ